MKYTRTQIDQLTIMHMHHIYNLPLRQWQNHIYCKAIASFSVYSGALTEHSALLQQHSEITFIRTRENANMVTTTVVTMTNKSNQFNKSNDQCISVNCSHLLKVQCVLIGDLWNSHSNTTRRQHYHCSLQLLLASQLS